VSVVLGILPNKGLPLPFVSAGGSSMLISMLSMGILLNISQHTTNVPRRGERLRADADAR
jgi:cell division protein FtsW